MECRRPMARCVQLVALLVVLGPDSVASDDCTQGSVDTEAALLHGDGHDDAARSSCEGEVAPQQSISTLESISKQTSGGSYSSHAEAAGRASVAVAVDPNTKVTVITPAGGEGAAALFARGLLRGCPAALCLGFAWGGCSAAQCHAARSPRSSPAATAARDSAGYAAVTGARAHAHSLLIPFPPPRNPNPNRLCDYDLMNFRSWHDGGGPGGAGGVVPREPRAP